MREHGTVDSPWDLVFLARHGLIEWNTQQRRQGQLDSPLTPDGIELARRNAAILTGQRIDGVFSSFPAGMQVTRFMPVLRNSAVACRCTPAAAPRFVLGHWVNSGRVGHQADIEFAESVGCVIQGSKRRACCAAARLIGNLPASSTAWMQARSRISG
jgi:hypothetical protein